MRMVPMKNAWQAQSFEISYLRRERTCGQLQLMRELHDVVQRHALKRDVIMLT